MSREHHCPWLAQLYSGEAEPSGVWDTTSTDVHLPHISHLYGQSFGLIWHSGPKNLKFLLEFILLLLFYTAGLSMLDWWLVKTLVYMRHFTELRCRVAPYQSNVTTAAEQNAEGTFFIKQTRVSS